jgi:hypothetical protein
LDQTVVSGYQEDMTLAAAPDGSLVAAWVEADTAAGTGNTLYVARLDPVAGTWALLGAGPVDPAAEARQPSIALYANTPWVAFLDESGGVAQVRVRSFNGVDSWVATGGVLNDNPGTAASRPVIAITGGTPTVAWIEGGTDIFVKTIQ